MWLNEETIYVSSLKYSKENIFNFQVIALYIHAIAIKPDPSAAIYLLNTRAETIANIKQIIPTTRPPTDLAIIFHHNKL